MGRYDKYVACEFGYMDDNGFRRLIYTGSEKQEYSGLECSRCGKELKGYIAHTFNDEDEAEWRFGSECVKYVFGAGLGK
ncbi:hypothetical protein [Paenibacillus naphthalenovorans]|uniref:Uncharacterized protein n=1 Tax=Paenibacillus naphthalenovorans TaxID=162209 RepID=A0A0U2MWH6_9BACL|nr:hypothetical protein [Paenibacillus naphthalenovorans]ALS22255.1 hypothetical protein IJ22_18810 [Paenibacillus naphthalenovorans]